MAKFTFWRSCPDFHVPEELDALRDMIDSEVGITRATFLRHVDADDMRRLEHSFGYARHPSQGLTMAKDWHVGYYKSTYQGKRVYFFRWSHFEYIFTEG